MNKLNNQAQLGSNLTDSAEKRRMLVKLKIDITGRIDDFKMSEDRKSFMLHQLNNVQDMEGMLSLIREINRLQTTLHAIS